MYECDFIYLVNIFWFIVPCKSNCDHTLVVVQCCFVFLLLCWSKLFVHKNRMCVFDSFYSISEFFFLSVNFREFRWCYVHAAKIYYDNMFCFVFTLFISTVMDFVLIIGDFYYFPLLKFTDIFHDVYVVVIYLFCIYLFAVSLSFARFVSFYQKNINSTHFAKYKTNTFKIILYSFVWYTDCVCVCFVILFIYLFNFICFLHGYIVPGCFKAQQIFLFTNFALLSLVYHFINRN